MKIDTLSFIQHLLNNQGQLPSVFHPHAPVLVPGRIFFYVKSISRKKFLCLHFLKLFVFIAAIITAVSDPFYKISSEALLVLESLVKVVRPLGSEKMKFDFRPYTDNIYQCCFVRLKASDIDQEVKERAISCMVRFLISHLKNWLILLN